MAKNTQRGAPADKVRVQFDFSRDSLDRLDQLVTASGAASRAETIRHALTMFAECVEARRRGAEILFLEPDGSKTRILPLI